MPSVISKCNVYLHQIFKMKNISLVLLALLLGNIIKAESDYLYRIHVGSFKRIDLPENIKEVPDIKKYVLPEGYNCFFSGGYFLFFEGAYRQLKKVKEKGFNKATIRVYKKEKLIIDKIDNNFLVEKELLLALMGIETNFGKYLGKMDIISSLAT